MEVRIRLQKVGKGADRSSHYRIVALPQKAARDGRTLDTMGYYDPSKKPAACFINKEKVNAWVAKGAQLSNTVRSLMKKK